jgi:hypothetical protein
MVLRKLYVILPKYFCAARVADPSLQVSPITPDPSDSPSLKHTPVKASKEEFDHVIDSFLTKCRPTMRALVEKAGDVPSFLPSWEPPSFADEELSRHVSGLRIPVVSSGRPSLLLHELGEEKSKLDKDRTARIPAIFSFSHHTYVTRHLSTYRS